MRFPPSSRLQRTSGSLEVSRGAAQNATSAKPPLKRRGRAGWGFGACARGGRKSWQRPDFVASVFRPASNASGIRSTAAKKKDRKIDVDPTFHVASFPRIRGKLSEHGAEPPAPARPRSEILPRFSPRISKHSTARHHSTVQPNFRTFKLLNL